MEHTTSESRSRISGREVWNRILEAFCAAGIAVMAGMALWTYIYATPCRVETDCRGMGIDVARLREWEEQEKDAYSGILDMAGWRIGKQQNVQSVSTGRRKSAAVVEVYGSAYLVYPAKLLSGDYVLPRPEADETSQTDGAGAGMASGAGGRKMCILTEELSDALFGSTDTAGESVKADGELLTVAGVIDKEGLYLLKTASEGTIEYAAFRMARRYQAEAKARQRVGGGY